VDAGYDRVAAAAAVVAAAVAVLAEAAAVAVGAAVAEAAYRDEDKLDVVADLVESAEAVAWVV
jgi:hypothetical protein